jgi:hypothetical protein
MAGAIQFSTTCDISQLGGGVTSSEGDNIDAWYLHRNGKWCG